MHYLPFDLPVALIENGIIRCAYEKLGVPVASILDGAGTLDGIFLAGILSLLLT